MKRFLTLLFLTLSFFSCNKEITLNANQIIDKSIEVSGGKRFQNSIISFDFRGRHYIAERHNGSFKLIREFSDSLGVYKDVLSNKGFKRFLNNEQIIVVDTMAAKYARSVNSVHYFSVLPFGLNDAAVNKTSLEAVNINGSLYHKVKVAFNQKGGGDDFEDIFVYWINANTFKVDYLAYSYLEDDGELGLRFREAFNERYVNGIRFADYNNYKPIDTSIILEDLDRVFQAKELVLLSKIELINIDVK
jgi:hypothetical protein